MTTMRSGLILLDGLVVLSIYAIGKKAFTRKVAVLAAGMYALYPPAIYMAGLGQPEVVLALCLMGLIMVWLRARSLNLSKAYFPVGILLGIALLLKPNYLGFFPFWVVAEMLFPTGGRKQTLLNLTVACGGVLVLTLPWYVFRLIHHNPTSSGNMYANIVYMGSILRPTLSDGSLMPLREFFTREFGLAKQLLNTNSPTAAMVLQLGIRNWLSLVWPNPLNLFGFLANKFVQIWYATDSAVYDKFFRWFQLPIVILWISGLIGGLSHYTMRTNHWPLLLTLGYTILALLIITPLFRELLPVIPIVLLFAAYGIERLASFIRRRFSFRVMDKTSP